MNSEEPNKSAIELSIDLKQDTDGVKQEAKRHSYDVIIKDVKDQATRNNLKK